MALCGPAEVTGGSRSGGAPAVSRHSPGSTGRWLPAAFVPESPSPVQATPGLCSLPTEAKVRCCPAGRTAVPVLGPGPAPRSAVTPRQRGPSRLPCPGSRSRGSPEPWGAQVPQQQPPGVIRGQGMALLPLPPRLRAPFRGELAPQPRRVLRWLLHGCAAAWAPWSPVCGRRVRGRRPCCRPSRDTKPHPFLLR